MMLSHNPIVEPFALAHATIVTGDKAGTILRNMTIVVGADGRIELRSWRRPKPNVWSPHSRIRHWASRTWPQP